PVEQPSLPLLEGVYTPSSPLISYLSIENAEKVPPYIPPLRIVSGYSCIEAYPTSFHSRKRLKMPYHGEKNI
ncbi:MAG: hypothetical protein QXG48_05360, partial [Thermofilaceae archaeon]